MVGELIADRYELEELVARSAAIGDTIRGRMELWQGRFPQVGHVRGLGAMLAIEIVSDRAAKTPDADLATRVVEEATARGLLLLKAGIYSNVIRVLVPLVIEDAELDEALDVWEESLEAALAGGSRAHLGSGEQD